MNCPKCKKEIDDKAEECPSCGIVFAKWKKRQGFLQKKATQLSLRRLEEINQSRSSWIIFSLILYPLLPFIIWPFGFPVRTLTVHQFQIHV